MKAVIKAPGAPAAEVELRAGVNRLGRSVNNDIPITHPSVSGTHCEILFNDGEATVRDLNSTNGTFINGARIQESQLEPGQTLRLGEVEIVIAGDAIRVNTVTATRLRLAPAENDPAATGTDAAPDVVKPPIPMPPPPSLLPQGARKKRPGFWQSIPGAFSYPFKENGLYLLLGGTVFLVVLDLVSRFGFGMIAALSGFVLTGYMFLFLQSIITTSASGDDSAPGWPEWDNWWETGVGPYLKMLGIGLCCLGPAWLCLKFAPSGSARFTIGATEISGAQALAIPLFIAGMLYLPMALLAVSMYETFAALNPALIVVSIFRVPAQYAATCLLLALLCGIDTVLLAAIDRFFPIPFASEIAARFFGLYLFMVATRLLGLLYFTMRQRLGWPFK